MMSGLASRQRLRGNDQQARVLIEHNIGAPGRERARGVERCQALGIGLAIGELLANVVRGARAIASKEGRESLPTHSLHR